MRHIVRTSAFLALFAASALEPRRSTCHAAQAALSDVHGARADRVAGAAGCGGQSRSGNRHVSWARSWTPCTATYSRTRSYPSREWPPDARRPPWSVPIASIRYRPAATCSRSATRCSIRSAYASSATRSTVTAGKITPYELGVPSPSTLARVMCTPAKLRFGPGVIVGHVFEGDTEQPATNTEVSVAWTETQVGTDIGVRTVPKVRKGIVATDGTYRICGVPSSFNGSLQAIRAGAKTAEVPMSVDEQLLTMRELYLPPAAVAAGDSTPVARPRAVVTGKVTNAGGVPVVGARVSVQGSPSSVATGTDGTFTLTGVSPGTQSVLVRRVGYTPVEMPIDVKLRSSNPLTVRLGTYTAQLSTLDVKAKADPLEATGFERRRKSGMGKYMNETDIDATHPTFTTDALRRIPGIYVVGSGQSASVYTQRGNGCVNYMIDRNPIPSSQGNQTIDELVNSRDLAAIEFYQTADIPMELTSGVNSGCALLVIWTKGELKDPRDTKSAPTSRASAQPRSARSPSPSSCRRKR